MTCQGSFLASSVDLIILTVQYLVPISYSLGAAGCCSRPLKVAGQERLVAA